MDRDVYLLHQTPSECAKDLLAFVPLVEGDILLEPFKGEGAFFNAFPDTHVKLWAELNEGVDYTTITEPYDWVITNPPFQLDTGNKKVNSFWFLIDYYSTRARKGIVFLANDRCFCTLTPRRMELLHSRGWGITKIVVSSIKKWRGRYFFIMLEKNKPSVIHHLTTNY